MDNQQLLALLREWFDNHDLIESEGEYYRCHTCKQGAWLRNEIPHTEDCLLMRTEKALYPMMVAKKRE